MTTKSFFLSLLLLWFNLQFLTDVLAIATRECADGSTGGGRRLKSVCITMDAAVANLSVTCTRGLLLVHSVQYGASEEGRCYGVSGNITCLQAANEISSSTFTPCPEQIQDAERSCSFLYQPSANEAATACDGQASFVQIEYECVPNATFTSVCSGGNATTATSGFVTDPWTAGVDTSSEELKCSCKLRYLTGGFTSPLVRVAVLNFTGSNDSLLVHEPFTSGKKLRNVGSSDYNSTNRGPVQIEFNTRTGDSAFLLFYSSDFPVELHCENITDPFNFEEATCPRGWQQKDENCFLNSNGNEKSWNAARSTCLACGADLINFPNDIQEYQYWNLFSDWRPAALWSGTHNPLKRKDSTWVYTTGEISRNYVSPSIRDNCRTITAKDDFNEGAKQCVAAFNFACVVRKDAVKPGTWRRAEAENCSYDIKKAAPREPVFDSAVCSDGWYHLAAGDKCVWFEFTQRNWTEAQEFCKNEKNAQLLTIRSHSEQVSLGAIFGSIITLGLDNNKNGYWTGLHLMEGSNSTWQWTYGAPLNTNLNDTFWANGEPNSYGRERCGELYNSVEMNDLFCNSLNYPICEQVLGIPREALRPCSAAATTTGTTAAHTSGTASDARRKKKRYLLAGISSGVAAIVILIIFLLSRKKILRALRIKRLDDQLHNLIT